MSQLLVKIDWSEKRAKFSGPGTFAAKDSIKGLGPARWNAQEKSWEVKPFTLTVTDLEALFPNITVEETSREVASFVGSVPEDAKGLTSQSPANILLGKEPSIPGLPASLTVAELFNKIRLALSQAFPGQIHVRGVVSSCKRREGRVFIELIDKNSPADRLDCIIWQNEERLLKPLTDAGFTLEQDLDVMFTVRVDVSKKGGRLSLRVEGVIAEYTVGKVAGLREVTNKRLKDEGLFSKNRELALPFVPRRLGILTSSTGTVIHDFREALETAKFGFELLWLDVTVQGQNARDEIVAGIRRLDTMKLDAILLFRGGGSPAELSVFSDYELAKSICLAKTPVISAIGHQEDQSSAQDVSFLAFGVPRDIGRYFAEIIIRFRDDFGLFVERIFRQAQDRTESLESHLSRLTSFLRGGMSQLVGLSEKELTRLQTVFPLMAEGLASQSAKRFAGLAPQVGALAQKAVTISHNMFHALVQRVHTGATFRIERVSERLIQVCRDNQSRTEHLLEVREKGLEMLERVLVDSGPEVQLKRGFSVVRSQSGKIITSSQGVEHGIELELEFKDGKLGAIVK